MVSDTDTIPLLDSKYGKVMKCITVNIWQVVEFYYKAKLNIDTEYLTIESLPWS